MQTANEINTDKFEVQFSFDANRFQTLAIVLTKGGAKIEATYSTINLLPQSGADYDRLKIIDKDDKFTYQILKVNI
ncbi:MAG TPA: hypothetical protein VG738_21185 [Chitinophagaceae bacterium]|nr:hypothetical protein [Chitinophagaceae bacterium]